MGNFFREEGGQGRENGRNGIKHEEKKNLSKSCTSIVHSTSSKSLETVL